MDDSTQQQQQQEHAIAAALQQQQQEEQIKEEQIKEQQQQQEQEQEQQQQEQEQQQQQQQEQQQFQHLSLHSAHDTLDHDALANRDANGLVLQTTLGSNADGQLILQHAAAATGNLLHHHDLANNVASHVLQDSHDHSSSSSSTTAAAAAAAVAAAATAASLASLESLDSVMAEAVVAASKSAVNGSVSTSPSSSSAPSVAAVAAIATGATLGSPSSSLPAGPSSSSMTSSSSSASRITSSANAMAMENGGEGSSGDRYDKCPAVFKWPADDWETWLDQEKTYCRWNMVRHRHRDKQTFARGPTASEWTREFQCDHAGQYRDRKNPNIDPSKKRKRNGSIKCNCPAFIKMRKQFHEDEVLIEYSWRHEGHVPDVMEDIKAHRVPQDLKAWIKERVNEGLDWKTVKSMITSGSPMLDELHPATKQNAKALFPSCYAFYANTARQFKNRGSSRSTSSPASERASRGGNVIRFDEKTALAQRLSQSPSPQTAQQSSSSSSREVHSSTGQDQKHSTSAEGSTHIPHTSTWQIVTLESTHPSGPGHGFTGSNGFHTNNANHDSQTLAVHTLTAPNTTHTSTHDHLKHQVLAISEPLLNAESISRVIREQGTAQDMAALSLVTSASLDGVNGAPGLGSLTTGATATSHDAAAAATVANMLYNSSREHSGLQEVGSASAGASTQGAVAALMQQQQQEQRTGTEVIQNQEQQQQQQQSEASATTLQQQIQQHVQDRSPRDMMLEVLRAIADLHKQMEATEQYGTQEDAMEIIESFANPIRLMKEALERRSSSSQP
ncbi:hypothetical protein BGX33_002665 [Mortierella sp. NVP41]|nr:hypothetical protein BGX33_002665 [Mortierella sp. NVP41]